MLVAGVSTRAAAESAAGAGFLVTAIDAFADLDQHPSVRSHALPRDFSQPFSARAAARLGKSIDCDAVAYLSNFENQPSAVSVLSSGRQLWGNGADVLRRVRNPLLLMEALRQRHVVVPEVRARGTNRGMPALRSARAKSGDECRWLVKPLASGGGQRVREWQPTRAGRNEELSAVCYLQELIEGTPASVVFVAARGRAVHLGVSRQLVGDPAFGSAGYRYCGNILASADDPQFAHDKSLVGAACELASAVVEEFDLTGVGGVDFIAQGDVPYPIEVNPRWSASMELVERAYGVSVFAAHAAACTTGELPSFELAEARRRSGAMGKAVVFARDEIVTGDTHAWLSDRNIRDVPRPGERIRVGRPVCSVFAGEADSTACYAALVKRADQLYAEMRQWRNS